MDDIFKNTSYLKSILKSHLDHFVEGELNKFGIFIDCIESDKERLAKDGVHSCRSNRLKVEVVASFADMRHIVGWPSCGYMRHCLGNWVGVRGVCHRANLKEHPHSLQFSR